MTETRTCNYNVQAFPEDEPRTCGERGIMNARQKNGDLNITYCKRHWAVAKDRVSAIATITLL